MKTPHAAGKWRTATPPTAEEMAQAAVWAVKAFEDPAAPPFSFTYGGKRSADIIGRWERTVETAGPGRTHIRYTDPQTRLRIFCEKTVFDDYPAVEWVLHFANDGTENTPLLEDVQALDTRTTRRDAPEVFYPKGEFQLYRWRGCMCRPEDFAEEVEVLEGGGRARLFSLGGRSSSGNESATSRRDGAMPFFTVQAVDEGLIVAVGWSGQWLAQLDREGARDLRLRAGLERTRLTLHPKERIRTPRILLFFWKGDRIAAQNKFRQFMLDHHTPARNGEPIPVPLAANGWFQFGYGNDVTEENQIDFVRRYAHRGIPLEHFWIDAGWYGDKGDWGADVGSWFPREDAFPRGLKPVADEVRRLGMGFFIWFEPERVRPGTRLHEEHPDWLLMPEDGMDPPNALLDLGRPEARAWVTELVWGMIRDLGLSVYRQDMNFDPLPYWRNADAPDRQGITEIRHIEGLYAFWDELRRRHPGLIIDNCATGGKRLDLEAMSRSVNLTRSDHSHPHAVQSHGFALSSFAPATAASGGYFNRIDSYTFRSTLAAGLALSWDVRDPDFDEGQARKNIKEFQTLRPLYYGDFYPLTGYSASKTAWMAYQIHREDLGRGAVLAFRREESPYVAAELHLRGLQPERQYELSDADSTSKVTLTGRALMGGLRVEMPEPRTSRILMYRTNR